MSLDLQSQPVAGAPRLPWPLPTLPAPPIPPPTPPPPLCLDLTEPTDVQDPIDLMAAHMPGSSWWVRRRRAEALLTAARGLPG